MRFVAASRVEYVGLYSSYVVNLRSKPDHWDDKISEFYSFLKLILNEYIFVKVKHEECKIKKIDNFFFLNDTQAKRKAWIIWAQYITVLWHAWGGDREKQKQRDLLQIKGDSGDPIV